MVSRSASRTMAVETAIKTASSSAMAWPSASSSNCKARHPQKLPSKDLPANRCHDVVP